MIIMTMKVGDEDDKKVNIDSFGASNGEGTSEGIGRGGKEDEDGIDDFAGEKFLEVGVIAT